MSFEWYTKARHRSSFCRTDSPKCFWISRKCSRRLIASFSLTRFRLLNRCWRGLPNTISIALNSYFRPLGCLPSTIFRPIARIKWPSSKPFSISCRSHWKPRVTSSISASRSSPSFYSSRRTPTTNTGLSTRRSSCRKTGKKRINQSWVLIFNSLSPSYPGTVSVCFLIDRPSS
jgi:hypothetical protein